MELQKLYAENANGRVYLPQKECLNNERPR